MYIEPCCIDRQLPKVLRESKSGFAFFQTNGDVTITKLLNATACMVAPDNLTLVVVMPEIEITTLRLMAHYFRQGWIRALLVLTQVPAHDLIVSELEDYKDRVHVAADPMVIDGQVAVIGPAVEGQSVRGLVIQGAMLAQPDFALSLYTAWCGNGNEVLHWALDAVIAKLNTKALTSTTDQPDIARILRRTF